MSLHRHLGAARAVLLPRVHASIKRNPWLARCARSSVEVAAELVDRSRAAAGLGYPPPRSTGLSARSLAESQPGVRFIPIDAPGSQHRSLPITMEGEVLPIYEAALDALTPELFVLSVPGARVYGQVVVISGDNEIVADVSRTSEQSIDEAGRTAWLTKVPRRLPKPKHLPGRTAVLTDYSAMGYGHWMAEVVPRLTLLERAGVDLDSVDHFLVNGQIAGFQRESLELSGVTSDRIVESIWTPHIEADELLVPSTLGDIRSPHPCAYLALRKRFGVAPTTSSDRVRLYLSREETSHRRVVNEAEVQNRLLRRGFQVLVPERLSLREKALLFARADAVVGPTGAGFVHLALADPGTIVLEFINPEAKDLHFWSAANILGQPYYYLSTTTVGGDGGGVGSSGDVQVDVDVLERTLDRAGL